VITACALPFGTTGGVAALMAASMPITSFQTPSRVVLARTLRLRSITAIDGTGLVAGYAWSIATVLAGFGVWGFASGSVARAAGGTLVILLVPGGKLHRPTLRKVRDLRHVIGFGVRFQANWVVIVLRDQAINIVTILLSTSVGATMSAETFLTANTLKIVALGLVAFAGGTTGGVLMAKLMNWLAGGNEINPIIGGAGVSAVPMAARVAQVIGQEEEPGNFLLMHAMGPNVAGVIGTAIAAGTMLALLH
jgi:hypothetical protein